MPEATPKTTSLTGEEFKSLALNNVAQLGNYLQAIAPHAEGGASGLTDQHIALIDAHMARCRMFLRSWSLTHLPAAPVQVEQPAAPATNGADVKPKGGWPKGKKRTPKQPAAAQ